MAREAGEGRWRVVFTEYQLLGKSHSFSPAQLSPVRENPTSIRGGDVRAGDLIGLGPGLGLRVTQTVFDGEDGLLIGRAECEGKTTDTRHGTLRNGQPYAAVVTASGTLHWMEGYRPEPLVIW